MSEAFSLLMFPAIIGILFLGFPIAFSLMGVALVFGLITFGPVVIFQFIEKVDEIASNYILAAVPLFVFMGTLLEQSGIANRLFDAIHIWTKKLPGGLAIGTIIMCIIFAASSGIIGATETVVGLLALPIMMKHAYNKGLISGTICAGGSLGTIIPPSIVVVILGPVADVSVGDLFMGMLIPGLLMSTSYIAYILIRCSLRPQDGSSLNDDSDDVDLNAKIKITIKALLPPLFLIFAVLGSIMAGIAAPTEAAGMGAMGAIILSILYKKFNYALLKDSLLKTLRITCMILLILLGGMMFSGVFIGAGGVELTSNLIENANLSAWTTLFIFLLISFIAGFVLEWISVLLIFIPVFIPIIKSLGFDPVWFCILFLIVIQTSYLTPPMAPAIFYLRGISREIAPSISIKDMFRGVVPFIILQLLTLALVIIFPKIALWLPEILLANKF